MRRRRRHNVSVVLLRLLSPLYRYDYVRDAYILRAIGQWHGPVLRKRP